jgi:hypothetical protein
MGFIALKPLTVGAVPRLAEDGSETLDADGHPVLDYIMRQPGEAVPEADEWPDAGAYVSAGCIQWVPDTEAKQLADLDQIKAQVRDLSETVKAQQEEIAALKSVAHSHDKQPAETKES